MYLELICRYVCVTGLEPDPLLFGSQESRSRRQAWHKVSSLWPGNLLVLRQAWRVDPGYYLLNKYN